MHNKDLQLEEFGEYLLLKALCRQRNAKFYVMWVRRFFRVAENWKPDSWDVLLQQFVNELRDKDEVEEWQVSQAEQAVRLYFANFRNGEEVPGQNTRRIELAADGSVSPLEVVSGMKESLRIQHYSYRTEQTYLDWIRRFFAYMQSCDSPDGPGRPTDASAAAVSPESVKTEFWKSLPFPMTELDDCADEVCIQEVFKDGVGTGIG